VTDARRAVVAFGVTIALAPLLGAQQVADRDFKPPIATPTYAEGKGPVVCVDEAHHNFHTLDGRFWAFGELLRRDGYRMRPLRSTLGRDSLAQCNVLVISNAQPNDDDWGTYPTPTPAAFTPAEVRAARAWVGRGGRLLLIADHMPLAGAAASLASAFGVTFTDGFAMEDFGDESDRDSALAKPTIFRISDGTLRPHAIVRGRAAGDSVTAIRTFVGQAFKAGVYNYYTRPFRVLREGANVRRTELRVRLYTGVIRPLLYKTAQTPARPLLALPFDLALRHLKYGKTS